MRFASIVPVALRRLLQRFADGADYGFATTRLWLLDRLLGPSPETQTDRAIREEGERLRKAFPSIDFDNPRHRTIPRPERR